MTYARYGTHAQRVHCLSILPRRSVFHHPASLGLLPSKCHRTIKTGIFFVSAKPIALQPRDSAVEALSELTKAANLQFQTYEILENATQKRIPRLTLSIVYDITKFKTLTLPLASLPPQAKDPDRPPSRSPLDVEIDDDVEDPPLPPELQPVLQDDGFPPTPEGEDPWKDWDEWDDDDESTDYDALDLKNTPDFDPYQDHESKHYSIDVLDAWMKSDEEECSKGAQPRLYECLDISNETKAPIDSEDYGPEPIGCEQSCPSPG